MRNLLAKPLATNRFEIDVNKRDLHNRFLEYARNHYQSLATLERIENCSTYFLYEVDKSWSNHKLKATNRCKMKLCPHCARVASLKRAIEASAILHHLADDGYKFLFITLTVKNVSAEQLSQMITKMNVAFSQRMSRYKPFKK